MQQQYELARKYYIETALKVRMFFQISFPYLLLLNSAPLLSFFKRSYSSIAYNIRTRVYNCIYMYSYTLYV